MSTENVNLQEAELAVQVSDEEDSDRGDSGAEPSPAAISVGSPGTSTPQNSPSNASPPSGNGSAAATSPPPALPSPAVVDNVDFVRAEVQSDSGSVSSATASKKMEALNLKDLEQRMQRRETGVFVEVNPILRKLGINPNARVVEEVFEILNFVMFARIFQWITLLISFSCVASEINNLPVSLSAFEWTLAVGVIGWVFSMADAFLSFQCIGENLSPTAGAVKVYLALFGDLFMAFMAISAFSTSAAVTSQSGVSFDKVVAAEVFMFLAWLSFLYSVLLSLLVYKDRQLLYVRLEQPARFQTSLAMAQSPSGPRPSTPVDRSIATV